MKLLNYLRRQWRRLRFFELLERSLWSLLVWAVSFQFFRWAFHLSEIFFSKPLQIHQMAAIVAISFWSWQLFLWSRRRITLPEVAEAVESQSKFFAEHPEHRSELVSAASFYESGRERDFEAAHFDVWTKRLDSYRVELVPRPFTFGFLAFSVLVFFVSFGGLKDLSHSLPTKVRAWNLSSYEQRLSFPAAEWESKSGALSSVVGAKLRFKAPDYSPLQTYLFVKFQDEAWRRIACEEYCEFKLEKRGVYAVGSLLFRSAQFPMLASADEAPKSIVFYKDGNDLIPSATLNAMNRQSLSLQLMATDDLGLKKVRLLHRFGEEEVVLLEKEVEELRYKEDYELSLQDWKGGRHEIVLEADDHFQVQESPPLNILFADEEFMRQQRILNIRGLIDQWLHVLADLLESEADKRLHPMLIERLEGLEWPVIDKEGHLQVYVEELRRLAKRMQEELEMLGIGQISEFIGLTEKQILYGLSLILQEQAGDLKSATKDLQGSQQNLQDLIDQIRRGEKELTPEAIQEAFERLAKQIEELQEKIRNLPQGPNDELINREALDEQLNESEQLQEKISQIQEQIANGQNDQALKELESLINQLSILSKEIGRSFDQWEENLAKGAMESSQSFENKLKALREREEQLAKKTDELQKAQTKEDELSEEEWAKLEEKFKQLEEEQREIREDFEKAQEEFQEKLGGSEWEQVFRSSEMQEIEEQISESMTKSEEALLRQKSPEALTQELQAAEYLRKAEEAQLQMRKNVEQMSKPQQASGNERHDENIEIVGSEGRGEKERRQKIMNSLRQKVDENYQKSHERYFEDLLQR